MRDDRSPRRTSSAGRQFDVWFGGIFLAVGLVVLVVGPVLFRVLRSDPDIGNGAWIALIAPVGVGAIFLVIGGIFFYRGLDKHQREQRLRVAGTTTEATIVAVETTNSTMNGRRLWRIRYVYDDLSGVAQMADSGYLSAEEAQSYCVGQRAFVRYDPDRPGDSVWLGRDELAE